MNDLSMRILELASGNEELAKRIEEAGSFEELAQLLNENGLDVTAEQVEAALSSDADSELSEDELAAIAGGDNCLCFAGGGGGGEHQDVHHRERMAKEKTCVCVLVGFASSETYAFRCVCVFVGTGDNS